MTRQSKEQILSDVHSYGVNLKLRYIYLHSMSSKGDDNNEETGVDHAQTTSFIKNLHVLDQVPRKPIVIHMNTTGGCWYYGMGIFNAIQAARSKIKILAYSQATSMSGIILQSAPVRVMMPDCHLMVHFGSSSTGANHPLANRSFIDFEERDIDRMISIFAERAINGPYFSGLKSATIDSAKKYISNKLKNKVDWYLDAEQAVHYGLSDGILGDDKYPNLESLVK